MIYIFKNHNLLFFRHNKLYWTLKNKARRDWTDKTNVEYEVISKLKHHSTFSAEAGNPKDIRDDVFQVDYVADKGFLILVTFIRFKLLSLTYFL